MFGIERVLYRQMTEEWQARELLHVVQESTRGEHYKLVVFFTTARQTQVECVLYIRIEYVLYRIESVLYIRSARDARPANPYNTCNTCKAMGYLAIPAIPARSAIPVTSMPSQFYAELFVAMGLPVLEIHSRKNQRQRTKISDEFRDGMCM